MKMEAQNKASLNSQLFLSLVPLSRRTSRIVKAILLLAMALCKCLRRTKNEDFSHSFELLPFSLLPSPFSLLPSSLSLPPAMSSFNECLTQEAYIHIYIHIYIYISPLVLCRLMSTSSEHPSFLLKMLVFQVVSHQFRSCQLCLKNVVKKVEFEGGSESQVLGTYSGHLTLLFHIPAVFGL